MAAKPPPKRETFRHGNLPEALIDAALVRLEAEGIEAISLRDLAGDAGVNHRAVYRHFPDKLTLLALCSGTRLATARATPEEGDRGQGARRTRAGRGQRCLLPLCARIPRICFT